MNLKESLTKQGWRLIRKSVTLPTELGPNDCELRLALDGVAHRRVRPVLLSRSGVREQLRAGMGWAFYIGFDSLLAIVSFWMARNFAGTSGAVYRNYDLSSLQK